MNNHVPSRSGFHKHSYDIDFNPGDNFLWRVGEKLVDDVNLLTPYPDKAYMRNYLAYEDIYKPSGSAYHFTDLVRVHINAALLGVWHLVENGDDNFLDRLGLDPNGALYKMYNSFI